MKVNGEGSLDGELDLETFLACVSIGCSSPSQGVMKLDWMGLYF